MHDATQMTANDGAARARRECATRHDRGSAMLVVMGAAAVLFVIAASVIGVVVFQQTQQVRAQAVVRASALAQQGMEVYLGALRTDPDYWDTTPTIAGRTQEGTWTVAANAASNTITAVGRESGSGMLHVIKAEARPESYSDYTIVTGGAVTLGRDTGTLALTGSVLSNGAPVDLAQTFNALTVYSPDPDTVEHPENARGGVQTHEGPQLDQIMDDFPNLFTAASQRDRGRRERRCPCSPRIS